jgi:hypothetical protein
MLELHCTVCVSRALTDLSHAAVHHLANSFVTPALLEHSGNLHSAGLHGPHLDGPLGEESYPSSGGKHGPVRIGLNLPSF